MVSETFYHFARDDKYDDVAYSDGTKWTGVVCPIDDGHQRPGPRAGALKVRMDDNVERDICWTFLSECLINNRMLRLLEKNDVTGYEVLPAQILNGHSKSQWWELVVTGTGGMAAKKSGIELKSKCDACGLEVYSAFTHGINIDSTQWDGSDVFTVIGYPKYVLVSNKIKSLMDKHQLKGAVVVPSSELEWPDGVVKP